MSSELRLFPAVPPIDVCPPVFSRMTASCQSEKNHGNTCSKSPNRNAAIFRTQGWPWAATLLDSKLLELLGDGRRYDYHRMLSRFLPIMPNRNVIPLMKTKS